MTQATQAESSWLGCVLQFAFIFHMHYIGIHDLIASADSPITADDPTHGFDPVNDR